MLFTLLIHILYHMHLMFRYLYFSLLLTCVLEFFFFFLDFLYFGINDKVMFWFYRKRVTSLIMERVLMSSMSKGLQHILVKQIITLLNLLFVRRLILLQDVRAQTKALQVFSYVFFFYHFTMKTYSSFKCPQMFPVYTL